MAVSTIFVAGFEIFLKMAYNVSAERKGVPFFPQFGIMQPLKTERTMADDFFKKTKCDRCGGSLAHGRIMSMYNEDCICMECKKKEMQRADYRRAVQADHEQIKQGNYNFKGIGWN